MTSSGFPSGVSLKEIRQSHQRQQRVDFLRSIFPEASEIALINFATQFGHSRIELVAKIYPLYNQGIRNIEIAEKLSIGKTTVSNLLSGLRTAGVKIADRSEIRQQDEDCREREEKIVELLKQGYPARSIGPLLDPPIPCRASSSLCRKILKRRHLEIEAGRSHWRLSEMAKKLKIKKSVSTISLHCQKGRIPCARCSVRGWVVTQEGIDKLEELYALRCCEVCGNRFVPPSRLSRHCSRRCSTRTMYLKRSQGTSKTLAPWIQELKQNLVAHSIPKMSRWVTIGEARKEIGMSSTLISYLARVKALQFIHHPTKTWRDKQPVKLYSLSELEIAWQVYRQHHPSR